MRNNKGFTLIELLIVIVILGILGTYAGVKFMGRVDDAKFNQAKIQIQSFEQALKIYRLDNGAYPSQEQGLQALIQKPSVGNIPSHWREGGYLEKNTLPKDPWNGEYWYLNPGQQNPNGVDIFSYGPDGQAGGNDDKSRDIGNWDDESENDS